MYRKASKGDIDEIIKIPNINKTKEELEKYIDRGYKYLYVYEKENSNIVGATFFGSDDIDDRIDDPEVEGVPEYAEHYVYMKDTSFGKNVYLIEYKTKGNELALEMKNSSELKFMGIGIVAPGKVSMSLDMILTDEGILVSGLASVKDKTPKINLLVYTIDLEESIMNRVVAIKNWFFDMIGE